MHFNPTIWFQEREKKHRRLEAERQMLLKNIDGVLKTLSERYKWDSVYIFGSVMDSEKFT
jgi:hypothetical protein